MLSWYINNGSFSSLLSHFGVDIFIYNIFSSMEAILGNYCETNGIKLTFTASAIRLNLRINPNETGEFRAVTWRIMHDTKLTNGSGNDCKKVTLKNNDQKSPIRLSMCVHWDYNETTNCHRFITYTWILNTWCHQ